MGVLKNFVPCPYEKTVTPAEGIRVRFVDAGHLLGSASIEVIINEDGKEKKIVFSGDIGNLNQPLIKDPVYLHDADYVVMESTYGDRSHGDRPDYVELLSEVIQRTFDRGGSVVIPSFAVGRTQEMLYFIRQIKEEGRVHGHDNFKVYVDSPLANEATTIFNEHIYDCFDEEAMALVNKGINPLMFPGLKTSITSDDSKAINFDEDWMQWHRSAAPFLTSQKTSASMKHRASRSRKLLFHQRLRRLHVHSRNWLPWDSALCLLSARVKGFRTKISTALREKCSHCVINGTVMICHKELKIKNNVKNAKTGEPMWFSGFAIDAKVCERSCQWQVLCMYLYTACSCTGKKFSLKLLSELWKAGPDKMLV